MVNDHKTVEAIKEQRRIVRGLYDLYEQWVRDNKTVTHPYIHEAFRSCIDVAEGKEPQECKCSGCMDKGAYARGYCQNCWDLDCDLDGSDNH